MIFYPNAKRNIGLNVVEKRTDGYHNIETIFFPIPLKDALEVVLNEEGNKPYTWSQSGINIDSTPDDNIVIKALHLLHQEYKIPPVQVHLHKMIPFGAGLGGGSADGAFMLKLINKEYHLDIPEDKLRQMATQLGADCPFFIKNRPAYATGIGDCLETVEVDLSGYYLALIKPPISVSTPEAYSGIQPQPSETSLKELIKLPVNQWKHHIKNDFERSVFDQYPEIGRIKMNLYEAGAVYASMSGSGSSVFGLFKKEPELSFKEDYFVWVKRM